MNDWYKIIKTHRGDFVVMKWIMKDSFQIQVNFCYMNKTTFCYYECKTEMEMNELFDELNKSDCFASLDTYKTSLN
jgi:hypothetical protein